MLKEESDKEERKQGCEPGGRQLAVNCWNNSMAARAILQPSGFTPQSSPFLLRTSKSILCLHLFGVSVRGRERLARIGSPSQMSSDKWCVKPTRERREKKSIIRLAEPVLRVTLSSIRRIIINELWAQNTHPDQLWHIYFRLDLSEAVHLCSVLVGQTNASKSKCPVEKRKELDDWSMVSLNVEANLYNWLKHDISGTHDESWNVFFLNFDFLKVRLVFLWFIKMNCCHCVIIREVKTYHHDMSVWNMALWLGYLED